MAKNTKNEQDGVLFHREIPKMPEGYYSGDKPNPNLRAFVEKHVKERPYNPDADDYDVPAFDKSIESTKANAIYNMHTYWSKKPHDAIRQYIQHYTEPGDLVLDSFCGSGGTALAALMEGRKAVAIDLSPAATFIAKNYCTPVDPSRLRSAFQQVERLVREEIDWLYSTKCHRCGSEATTISTVYSQVFQCPRCLEQVPFFDCVETEVVTQAGKIKRITVCPICKKEGHNEEIGQRLPRIGFVPVLFSYECNRTPKACKPKRHARHYADKDDAARMALGADIEKLRDMEGRQIPHEVPQDTMMHCDGEGRWGLLWRPYLEGIRKASDFFTKRNLWAILAIRDAVKQLECDESVRDFLLCGVTAILFKSSRMMGYRDDGIGRVMTGTYWIPPLLKDINVWSYYQEWFGDAQRHVAQKNSALARYPSLSIMISTETAVDLSSIPASSVDYIFTDPPYSWKVQYGESNFLWEVFLGLNSRWHDDEIIVNEFRLKSETEWAEKMRLAISECYRVLRPGRWLSLCYHDTSEGTWSLIQDIMAEAGFLVDQSESAVFIDADQKSIKQITADKVNKRDLVINFRKPRPNEVGVMLAITGDEDPSTFGEKVRAVICDYLSTNPGTTKDRIYDEVVSRMVRAGQMEAHNFDELLNQVAEEVREPVRENLLENKRPDLFGSHEMSRWYLKESEITAVDSAESAKEDASARNIRAFMSECLGENPESEGVHYSDIFEHYVYTAKDKPRRPLAEWLLDYFYKTGGGTYRLPESEEEERIKTEARASGTIRHIKHYIAHLQQGAPVMDRDRPSDSTLAEWIRHCKRSGLYEQGKLLYERGGLNLDNLSEEALVDVEEDYQVCARILARDGGNAKKGKRGG